MCIFWVEWKAFYLPTNKTKCTRHIHTLANSKRQTNTTKLKTMKFKFIVVNQFESEEWKMSE